MIVIFRGYVLTNNKRCVEKLKNRTEFKTYEQVKNLPEFAGVLAEDIILIDIDDAETSEILHKIVVDKKLRCRIYNTSRGKHFIFKNNGVTANKTKANLAITLSSDIKLGCKCSYSILKYDNKEREIVYDSEELQDLPKWLRPIKTSIEFLKMKEGDGRNQALFNFILTLQSNDFTPDEARETLHIINDYILKKPLSVKELETLSRDEAFSKPVFYKGNSFLFDKFAMFLKNNHHIIKINNQLYLYKDGIYISGTCEIESVMIKHLPNLSRSKRAEVLSYLDILIRDNTTASPAHLIAFKNGIYNLQEDTLQPYSPDMIVTNKIDWEYNPEAYSKVADNTLNKMACQDEQVRSLLEEVVGYCLYRRNELGKAFILTGDKSNGKSTFLDMVKTLLGENNISALDLKELGDRFKTAELFGKLANIGDDIGDEFIANASVFKKLVTGDRLNVERKGQNPFDMNNYSKMLFSANNIPRIKDKTGAVLRRLIIIPFNAVFSPNDADYRPYIKYELRQQEPIEYLIKIALNGLKRVLENHKFTSCEKVEKELEEYEEHNNPIITFLKEIETHEVLNQPTNEVYRKYHEFCLTNALQPLSKIEFSKQINKRLNYVTVPKKIEGKSYRVFVREC